MKALSSYNKISWYRRSELSISAFILIHALIQQERMENRVNTLSIDAHEHWSHTQTHDHYYLYLVLFTMTDATGEDMLLAYLGV